MIRSATFDDLPAIVAIYNATIASRASTAELEPVTVEGRRAWFERHAPGRLLVVDDDGVVPAWLGVLPHHERAAYAITGEVAVYVAPDARRGGYGGRLLDAAIERAPSWGLQVLLGRIFAHNEASLALFEGRGFLRWGLLPGVCVLDGVARDVVIMGRRVAP